MRQWPPLGNNITITASTVLHCDFVGAGRGKKEKTPHSSPKGRSPRHPSFICFFYISITLFVAFKWSLTSSNATWRRNGDGYRFNAAHHFMARFAPAADCKLNYGAVTHLPSAALCQAFSEVSPWSTPHLACPPPTPAVKTTNSSQVIQLFPCTTFRRQMGPFSAVSLLVRIKTCADAKKGKSTASAVSFLVRLQTCAGAKGVCTFFTTDRPCPFSSAVVGRKKKNMLPQNIRSAGVFRAVHFGARDTESQEEVNLYKRAGMLNQTLGHTLRGTLAATKSWLISSATTGRYKDYRGRSQPCTPCGCWKSRVCVVRPSHR